MIDELCELIQGEDGLLVELRMDLVFNEEKYQRMRSGGGLMLYLKKLCLQLLI